MVRGRRSWSLGTRLGSCLVVMAAGLAGCGAGAPSTTSAWQGATDRTLGQAIAGLGTARVVVEQESRGRLPHTYAVVTVTDSLDTSSKEIAGYLVAQPPDRLHAANQVVVTALHSAAELLVEVRVALASPGLSRSAARGLLARIDALRQRLDRLDGTVTSAPGSVAGS